MVNKKTTTTTSSGRSAAALRSFCLDLRAAEKHILLSQSRTRWARGGGFFACATLGALQPGHLLLLPNFHARSIAAAVNSAPRTAEFEEFRDQLRALLKDKFEAPVLEFEHGLAEHSMHRSCGTQHAHLHLLPCKAPVFALAERTLRPWILSRSYCEETLSVAVGQDYLSLTQEGLGTFVHPIPRQRPIPSQFLRKLVAEALEKKRDTWDWRNTNNRRDDRAALSRLGFIDLEKSRFIIQPLWPARGRRIS